MIKAKENAVRLFWSQRLFGGFRIGGTIPLRPARPGILTLLLILAGLLALWSFL